MSSFEYVLFDLDGTVVDSGPGIMNSVRYAFDKAGITEEDSDRLKRFVGPPLRVSFRDFYGMDEEQTNKAVVDYREYYREKGIFECKLYDGITTLLADICASGRRVVLATSKPEYFAVQILKHFDIYKYFTFVAGAASDDTRNDKESVIRYALENVHVEDLSKVLMVGDRCFDVEGAKAVGLCVCGVTYGYGSRAELTGAGADFIADTMDEIKFIVQGE